MADNITTTIATDDVSGAHYQRVKLDGGGDGAAAPIGGDSTYGLDVDVTRQVPVALKNGFETTDNVYAATVVASAAGASKNHLSIYNADASLKVDILQVYVTKECTGDVTGLVRGHRLFRFTTAHSSGSSVTPVRLDTTMTALDSDVTAIANSTIGGAESVALCAIGVGEENSGTTGGRLMLFDHRETRRPITLNQNEGVAVQQDATAGTGLVSVGILFRVR